MSLVRIQKPFSWIVSRTFLRLVLLLITSILAFTALTFSVSLRPDAFPLSVGSVAQQDIQAPTTLSYVSNEMTETARVEAENSVAPIYLPADPTITRTQIEKLRMALDYIGSVRADAYASSEQKAEDLTALENLALDQAMVDQILMLSEARWETVKVESLSVLEQVMRNTIRQDQLFEIRRNIPTLISFALPQDQAELVNVIVTQFVVPNSLYSEEQTSQARLDAREAVEPVYNTYVAGETIVQRGQVISSLIYEALEQYNLVQPQRNLENLISSGVLVLSVASFVTLYFIRRKFAQLERLNSLFWVSVIFLIFLFVARFVIPNRTVLPYLYPLSAFGLTISSLFGIEISLVLTLVLSILSAYGLQNGLDLQLYYILASFCGILMLGQARRVASFFWAGIAIGLAGSAVVIAYRLVDSSTDWLGIATLVGSAFFNGMLSASLSLLFQYLFSQILGLTTALQLLEISRPDHPLLQYLMRNAPGTYQHSLQVSNLAEQAAEAIGADALLVRVGALYHDVGKASNSQFYIENQIPGSPNPHEQLDPVTSATTIIRHVTDGVALARRHRLPPRIKDFVLEHHGTLITRYQYAKAVEAAGGNTDLVDEEIFRYPGPPPHSRETALLMLADGCEARARAELPKDDEELRVLVKRVIEFCEREGQLDHTTLTLKDLSITSESFVNTLRNTHHPRLKYPELKTVPRTQPALEGPEPDPSLPSSTSTASQET